jgi:N-acetylglucosaminyldiphosphoundecaprenol N-acetyl-beta-D-mannosaminyltransferase
MPSPVTTVLPIDDYDVAEFAALAARFGYERYGYVVTPNVDQIIRYFDDREFRTLYAEAAYVLFDSRFLAHWLSLFRHQQVRVCPGSDLTPRVLAQARASHERIVLVGGTVAQAQRLAAEFNLSDLVHVQPPMGFIRSSEEVERCVRAIEAASPFRYCFLAVGSPQQEVVAHRLKSRGHARGLALCVGASINFLTGAERRAPRWMRRWGFEWLFRLVQSRGRLSRRYLVRGPRIFRLLRSLRIKLRRTESEAVLPVW